MSRNISSNVHIFPLKAVSRTSFFTFLQKSLNLHSSEIDHLKDLERIKVNSVSFLKSRGVKHLKFNKEEGRYEASQFRLMIDTTCKLMFGN